MKRVADDVRNSKYDVLINNAGVGVYGAFDQTSLETTQSMLRLNIDSLVMLSHAYLQNAKDERDGIDLTVEAYLETRAMREAGMKPERISKGNLRELYWSLAQMITHHTSNGCNLRVGDLLATGTISGPDEGSEGCLLEMRTKPAYLRSAPNG